MTKDDFYRTHSKQKIDDLARNGLVPVFDHKTGELICFKNPKTNHTIGYLYAQDQFKCRGGLSYSNNNSKHMDAKTLKDFYPLSQEERERKEFSDRFAEELSEKINNQLQDDLATGMALSQVPSETVCELSRVIAESSAFSGLHTESEYYSLPFLNDASILKITRIKEESPILKFIFDKVYDRATGLGSARTKVNGENTYHYFFVTQSDEDKLAELNSAAKRILDENVAIPVMDSTRAKVEEIQTQARKIMFRNDGVENKANKRKLDVNEFINDKLYLEGESYEGFKNRLYSFVSSRGVNPDTVDLTNFHWNFVTTHTPLDVLEEGARIDKVLRPYCQTISYPIELLRDMQSTVKTQPLPEEKKEELNKLSEYAVKIREELEKEREADTNIEPAPVPYGEVEWKKDKFKEYTDEMYDIFVKKNSDYTASNSTGSAFDFTYDALGPTAPAVRFLDKVCRYISLASGKKQMVADEKIKDTLTDLANYALLTRLKIEWDEKNKNEKENK